MKKLVYLASALMIFGLTSCNNEVGPEYTTPPVVGNLSMTPHIVKLSDTDTAPIENVYEDQEVTLTGTLSNTYGWCTVYLRYRTMAPSEYEDKDDEAVKQLWMNKFTATDEESKKMNLEKTAETAPVSNMPFSFTISGLPAGTRVRWDFGVFNQYSLGFGYIASGYLPQFEYTVKAEE